MCLTAMSIEIFYAKKARKKFNIESWKGLQLLKIIKMILIYKKYVKVKFQHLRKSCFFKTNLPKFIIINISCPHLKPSTIAINGDIRIRTII